jgi:hypothetical protein
MSLRAWIVPVLVLCTGCAGYRLGPVQPAAMKDVKTIAVPTFSNESLMPRLEVIMANSVIKHLQQDGTYKLGSTENADAILEGTVMSITRSPSRAVRGNVIAASEFRLALNVDFKIKRRSTGAVLDQRSVTGNTSFFVSSDVQQDEQQALPLAAEDAAIKLVSQISEGW